MSFCYYREFTKPNKKCNIYTWGYYIRLNYNFQLEGEEDMEVHFQFNGKEYVDTILKNHLGSREFKRSLIYQSILLMVVVILFALRIRYRKIRYVFIICGIIFMFFLKKINILKLNNAFHQMYSVKDDDIRIMHIKLEDNFMTVSQVMEESKYSYDAVKELYVMGDYLYIKFVNDRIAFVHARAFRDGDSVKKFVELLEKKANLRVYRKKDELVR